MGNRVPFSLTRLLGGAVILPLLAWLVAAPARAGGPPPADAIDPQLVGTWLFEDGRTITTPDDVFVFLTKHYVRIEADGRFFARSVDGFSATNPFLSGTGLAEANERGRVLRQGDTLVFQFDNGQRWVARFRVAGRDGLYLNGTLYLRQ